MWQAQIHQWILIFRHFSKLFMSLLIRRVKIPSPARGIRDFSSPESRGILSMGFAGFSGFLTAMAAFIVSWHNGLHLNLAFLDLKGKLLLVALVANCWLLKSEVIKCKYLYQSFFRIKISFQWYKAKNYRLKSIVKIKK